MHDGRGAGQKSLCTEEVNAQEQDKCLTEFKKLVNARGTRQKSHCLEEVNVQGI